MDALVTVESSGVEHGVTTVEVTDPIFSLIEENRKAETEFKNSFLREDDGGSDELCGKANDTLTTVVETEPTTPNGHYNKLAYLVEYDNGKSLPVLPGMAKAIFESAKALYDEIGDV